MQPINHLIRSAHRSDTDSHPCTAISCAASKPASRSALVCIIGLCLFLLPMSTPAIRFATAAPPALKGIGPKESVKLVDPLNHPIAAVNQDTALIPASTLKIFTALMALHYLGGDYRFVTDFFMDADGNLRVKGYGDPLLISEVLDDIAGTLAQKVSRIGDIVIDDAYFAKPLTIPGITDSYEPYDAPNGAVVANFNTVNFKRRNGRYVSAEPQTPLLPMVVNRIKHSGLRRGRIVLSHHNRECTRYFGRLLQYFLQQNGVETTGSIRPASSPTGFGDHRLLYRYTSRFNLEQIVAKLLEYSNNYMTNQVLITVGAKRFGPPGTLTKGVKAAESYARNELGLHHLTVVEGSGISRINRVTAREMIRILDYFRPHYRLLRRGNGEFYKTGTLRGISTRAGYLVDRRHRLYPYVILVNSGRRSAEQILDQLRKLLP